MALFGVEIFSTVLQRMFCDNTLEKRECGRHCDLFSWGAYFLLLHAVSRAIMNDSDRAWLNIPAFMILFFGTVRMRYRDSGRVLLTVTLFVSFSGMCAELAAYYVKELLPWRLDGKEDLLRGVISKSIWFLLMQTTSRLIKTNGQAERRTRQSEYETGPEEVNKEWWEQIRLFQHDMKQRYIVERAFLEKKDYAALEKYCDKNIEFLSGKENAAATGNIYVDSILNTKADLARKEEIELVMDIHIPGDVELDAEDFGLCMGNLLDNAMEAVRELPDKKVIYTQINADRHNLFIQIKNRYRDQRRKEAGRYLTNKPDRKNHGLGMRSIRQIAEKYDGEVIVREEDGVFAVEVLLYDFLKYYTHER